VRADVDTSLKVAEAGGDQGLRVQALFDAAGHARASYVLKQAYDIAAAWHDGQLRLSGDPYITHLVEVALICQDLGMGPAVQCAALLHDVLIDTAYTTGQLRRDFSSEIAGLVEEVTRLRCDVRRGRRGLCRH
jgi:(p)ppGpp synthase/HD superfamily hydrolase